MKPGPQFTQLAMFATAHELTTRKHTEPGDLNPGERVHDLWRYKKEEALHEGLWRSVRNEGVKEPVELMHDSPWGGRQGQPVLENGHHRAAAARMVGKDTLVPVHHLDNAQLMYDDRVRGARAAGA